MTEHCSHEDNETEIGVRELNFDSPESPMRLLHDLLEVNAGSYLNTESMSSGAFVRIAGTVTDRNDPAGPDQVPAPLELILSVDQAHALAHGLVDVLKFMSENSEPNA